MLVNYTDGRYNLRDVLDMIPWELDIFISKFSNYIDKVNEK